MFIKIYMELFNIKEVYQHKFHKINMYNVLVIAFYILIDVHFP